MAEVVSFAGGIVPDLREPNAQLITMIEDLLEAVRSGEVQGVGYCAIHHDRLSSWCVGGAIGGYSILGAVTAMQHDILQTVMS